MLQRNSRTGRLVKMTWLWSALFLIHVTFAVTKLFVNLFGLYQNIHISLFLMPCHAEEFGSQRSLKICQLPIFLQMILYEGMALGLLTFW